MIVIMIIITIITMTMSTMAALGFGRAVKVVRMCLYMLLTVWRFILNAYVSMYVCDVCVHVCARVCVGVCVCMCVCVYNRERDNMMEERSSE